MFTRLENNYLNVIKEEFTLPEPLREARGQILTWLVHVRDGHETHEQIEAYAKTILQTYPQLKYGESHRYQFKANCHKAQLIKIIFNNAFKPTTAKKIITAAEGANRGSFFPTWKKVTHIHLPRIAGEVIGNPVIKVALSVAMVYGTIIAVPHLYNTVADFTVRVVIPYVINHAPLTVIKVFNAALSALEWIRFQVFKVLFYSTLARLVVTWLKIPYIGPALERINDKVWDFYFSLCSKGTLTGFIVEKGFKALSFTWDACTAISSQLRTIANHAEHQRCILSREKAYDVWSKMMNRAAI